MRQFLSLLFVVSMAACTGDDAKDDTGDDTGTINDADGDGLTVDEDCDDGNPDIGAPSTWYADSDGDGFSGDENPVEDCVQPNGYNATADDCDDANGQIYPGATEYCDEIDQDCDGETGDAESVDALTLYADSDGDGYGDEAVTSTACEPGSGTSVDNTDCDDGDALINPGMSELCDDDNVDENCNGLADDSDPDTLTATMTEFFTDGDGDGYGEDASGIIQCDPATGLALLGDDCDDSNDQINPGASEVCDENDVDENCNGVADDDDGELDTATQTTWYPDTDDDGYGDASSAGAALCDATDEYELADNSDCSDADSAIHPAATEVCDENNVDEDCNSVADDDDSGVDASSQFTWYSDGDGDGYGDDNSSMAACDQPSGYTDMANDCDDADANVSPDAIEVCDDQLDNNCDGSDNGCDLSGDIDLGAADAIFVREVADDSAGWSVAGSGDVDGDGYSDLVIGAMEDSVGGSNAGATYLMYGPVSGSIDLASADAKITGHTAGMESGCSVAIAGDVDGDGRDDLLIGAEEDGQGGSQSGAAYLVLGPIAGSLDLSTADASILGETSYEQVGRTVAGLGDMNGDSYADIIVGADQNDTTDTNAGAAYLFLGPLSGSMGIGSADASLYGENAHDQAGRPVSGAGDVNDDGVTDVLIGAMLDDTTDGSAGAAYLLYGPVTGVINLADSDSKITGEAAFDYAGGSLASAGDVDDDGYDDILVGAHGTDGSSGNNTGAAYLLYGPVTGDINLSAADARLEGVNPGDEAGFSVAGPGDVNYDGYDDMVIGAVSDDSGGTDGGASYLVFGPVTGSINLSSSDARLLGASGKTSWSVSAAGDVNADGYRDLFIGAYGGDNAAYLVLGGGL